MSAVTIRDRRWLKEPTKVLRSSNISDRSVNFKAPFELEIVKELALHTLVKLLIHASCTPGDGSEIMEASLQWQPPPRPSKLFSR